MRLTSKNCGVRRIGTHEPVQLGEWIQHHGKNELLFEFEYPHKTASEGFITTDAGRFYASVYGLEFWPPPDRDEENGITVETIDGPQRMRATKPVTTKRII